MTRIEWILAGLLGILVVVVGALLVVFWRQQQNTVFEDSATEHSISAASSTAKSAYAQAEPAARKWASDARLVSASGAWQPNSFAPDGGTWGFLFYSEREAATLLISVRDQEAVLIGPAPSDLREAPADLTHWTADSPAVVDSVLNDGGQSFIDSHGEVELALTLDASQELLWRATLLAPETGERVEMVVSPATGQVLSGS